MATRQSDWVTEELADKCKFIYYADVERLDENPFLNVAIGQSDKIYFKFIAVDCSRSMIQKISSPGFYFSTHSRPNMLKW